MILRKKLYDKFSIVLALAAIFIALPTIAAAQASKIAFDTDRDGGLDIYVMNADGSDLTRLNTSY